LPERVQNVLFLCRSNSARSVLAEAILKELGQGRFRAFSAGSKPRASIQPYALNVLHLAGPDVSQLRSKSSQEFRGAGAPVIDFVFDLSNEVGEGLCTDWPGRPIFVNWTSQGHPAA
jgi:arsenate reductase